MLRNKKGIINSYGRFDIFKDDQFGIVIFEDVYKYGDQGRQIIIL